MRRAAFSLLVTVLAVAVAPPSAVAKDGVRATLATDVPLDAAPRTRLRVGWTLAYTEGGGDRRPFGASGVFVRLVSASGARAETAFAPTASHTRGEYEATVAVPEGGIGDVEIGLVGWTSGPRGAHRADLVFPITNDPVPGAPRAASPSPAEALARPAGGSSRAWIAVGLAALLAACIAAAGVARGLRATHP